MPLAPTVGVVVANYNNGAFVAKAIESVARQTARDFRTIIIDDASTDGSDEAIRGCLAGLNDSRFDYVRLENNLGQGGAVRRGLAKLDTPFVCFLDSDDVWYENFLARHLSVHMNADFPVALTYCDSHIIDGDDRLLAGTAWWFDADPYPPPARPIDQAHIPAFDPATGTLTYPANAGIMLRAEWTSASSTNSTASMMFRRSFVDLVLVPPDEDLRLYLDFYLSTFALLLTGAMGIHEALYAYRMHGQNKHSNATVLGGRYNSASQPWGPIANSVLELVHKVLKDRAEAFLLAFGEERYEKAETQMRGALGLLDEPKPRTWRSIFGFGDRS